MNWLKASIGILLLIVLSISLYWLLPVTYLDSWPIEIGIVLITISAAIILRSFSRDSQQHIFKFIKPFNAKMILFAGCGLIGLGFVWFAVSAVVIGAPDPIKGTALSDNKAELVVLPALLFFASGLSLVIFRVFQWFSS